VHAFREGFHAFDLNFYFLFYYYPRSLDQCKSSNGMDCDFFSRWVYTRDNALDRAGREIFIDKNEGFLVSVAW
jgi:hypothetical protein